MTEQKIYLICSPCEDSYYQGHPTNIAFTTRDAANAYLKDNNLNGDEDELYTYYVQEVTVYGF